MINDDLDWKPNQYVVADSEEGGISYSPLYDINWDTVKTLKDLKILLSALQMQIGPPHQDFEHLKKYLIIPR